MGVTIEYTSREVHDPTPVLPGEGGEAILWWAGIAGLPGRLESLPYESRAF